MGTAKKAAPEGEWLQLLAEAVLAALEDGVERERFLEVAGETWDDTKAEEAEPAAAETAEKGST